MAGLEVELLIEEMCEAKSLRYSSSQSTVPLTRLASDQPPMSRTVWL
jgi:hypothetical protein